MSLIGYLIKLHLINKPFYQEYAEPSWGLKVLDFSKSKLFGRTKKILNRATKID